MAKKTPSYVDTLVGHTPVTRSGAAYILRHWRALGYRPQRHVYTPRLRAWYIGDRLGFEPGSASVFV